MTGYLADAIPYVPEPKEADWRPWARALVLAPSLQGYNLPGPEPFPDWLAWATALKRAFTGP